MPGTTKHKISASRMVCDILSGMNESELKLKYGLRDNSIDQVLSKLVAAGKLTETEIRTWRKSNEDRGPVPQVRAGISNWRCPSCNAPQLEEPDECPVCGVVIKKLLSRREHGENIPPTIEQSSSLGKAWLIAVASIIAFAIVGTGLIWWSKHRAEHKPGITALSTKPQPSGVANTERYSDQVSSEQEGTWDTLSSEKPDGGASDMDSSPGSRFPPDRTSRGDSPSRQTEKPSGSQTSPHREKEPPSDKYRTGVLRQFTSKDFKEEVAEASKTFPVVFQFFSST
ncbi:MAG: hypothetical protein HY912_20555 [Desulfomonile tiedjei]|uniref:Uncharacterized protein n=1 Tax=Desulfomonile tiedjei TaxID=2358 RepID=A0A9D6V794_9BACT|nr:hypothetical protein [Desulfomonile tiedjei]